MHPNRPVRGHAPSGAHGPADHQLGGGWEPLNRLCETHESVQVRNGVRRAGTAASSRRRGRMRPPVRLRGYTRTRTYTRCCCANVHVHTTVLVGRFTCVVRFLISLSVHLRAHSLQWEDVGVSHSRVRWVGIANVDGNEPRAPCVEGAHGGGGALEGDARSSRNLPARESGDLSPKGWWASLAPEPARPRPRPWRAAPGGHIGQT